MEDEGGKSKVQRTERGLSCMGDRSRNRNKYLLTGSDILNLEGAWLALKRRYREKYVVKSELMKMEREKELFTRLDGSFFNLLLTRV